jgi:hypothetical protein
MEAPIGIGKSKQSVQGVSIVLVVDFHYVSSVVVGVVERHELDRTLSLLRRKT